MPRRQMTYLEKILRDHVDIPDPPTPADRPRRRSRPNLQFVYHRSRRNTETDYRRHSIGHVRQSNTDVRFNQRCSIPDETAFCRSRESTRASQHVHLAMPGSSRDAELRRDQSFPTFQGDAVRANHTWTGHFSGNTAYATQYEHLFVRYNSRDSMFRREQRSPRVRDTNTRVYPTSYCDGTLPIVQRSPFIRNDPVRVYPTGREYSSCPTLDDSIRANPTPPSHRPRGATHTDWDEHCAYLNCDDSEPNREQADLTSNVEDIVEPLAHLSVQSSPDCGSPEAYSTEVGSSFPWLIETISQMPLEYRQRFEAASIDVLERITSKNHLHVYVVAPLWDEMVYIGVVLAELTTAKNKRDIVAMSEPVKSGCVIVVDDINGGFHEYVALAKMVLRSEGQSFGIDRHGNPTIHKFDNVSVVKGSRLRTDCGNHQEYEKCLDEAGNRVVGSIHMLANKLRTTHHVVWHNHENPELLLHCLQSCHSHIEPYAVTLFRALKIGNKSLRMWNQSAPGLPDPWPALLRHSHDKRIPLLFYSNASHAKLFTSSLHDLPDFKETWPTLIPEVAWRSRLSKTLDVVTTLMFQLKASRDGINWMNDPSWVSNQVINKLPSYVAREWTSRSVDPSSYDYENAKQLDESATEYHEPEEGSYNILASLAEMIEVPFPPHTAYAIIRLAVGCAASTNLLHAARMELTQNPIGQASPLSMRLTTNPRAMCYMLTSPDPTALMDTIIASRWCPYIDEVKSVHNAAEAVGEPRSLGISAEVAQVWTDVISGDGNRSAKPGIVSEVLEGWARMKNREVKNLDEPTQVLFWNKLNAVYRACDRGLFSRLVQRTRKVIERGEQSWYGQ